MAQAEMVTVRMSRGHVSTGWGFDIGPKLTIANVIVGSLADRAGLLNGDQLVELEGHQNLSGESAKQLLEKTEHRVELMVHRIANVPHKIWQPSVTENTEYNRFQHSVHNIPHSTDSKDAVHPTNLKPSQQHDVPLKVSLEHKNAEGIPIPGFNISAQPFGEHQEVRHLQYNSPMPLYSTQSAAEQYLQQTGGLFGTDPNLKKAKEMPSYLQSETLRLIQESERSKKSTENVQPIKHVPIKQETQSFGENTSGAPQCFICGRSILGAMCRAYERTMHGECFQCSTCGSSLKNLGHHFINEKFYCDVHGRQHSGGRDQLNSSPMRRSPFVASTTKDNLRLSYQPEVMARHPLSISPTPWKTQSPISPSNRGVPAAATHYGQELNELKKEIYNTGYSGSGAVNQVGRLRSLPAEIRLATSPRRFSSKYSWPPDHAAPVRKYWRISDQVCSPEHLIDEVEEAFELSTSDGVSHTDGHRDAAEAHHSYWPSHNHSALDRQSSVGDCHFQSQRQQCNNYGLFDECRNSSNLSAHSDIGEARNFALRGPNHFVVNLSDNSIFCDEAITGTLCRTGSSCSSSRSVITTTTNAEHSQSDQVDQVEYTIRIQCDKISETRCLDSSESAVNHRGQQVHLNTDAECCSSTSVCIGDDVTHRTVVRLDNDDCAWDCANRLDCTGPDEHDKQLAIESIMRYQNRLSEPEIELSQELNNTIVFLQSLDTKLTRPSNGNDRLKMSVDDDGLENSSEGQASTVSRDVEPQLEPIAIGSSKLIANAVSLIRSEGTTQRCKLGEENCWSYNTDLESIKIGSQPPPPPPLPPPLSAHKAHGSVISDPSSKIGPKLGAMKTPSERIVETILESDRRDRSSRNLYTKTTNVHEQTSRQMDEIGRGRGILHDQGGRIPFCDECRHEIRGAYVLANGAAFCPEHFVCANKACARRLLDVGFVEEKGRKYCERCFESLIAPRCAKCSQPITADCLNALQKQWHPQCFVCAHCHKPFGNSAFFLEHGKPYCENDWNTLFTTKCVSCNYPIEAGDRWVEALGSAFHSNCFNCTNCNANLEGESFYAKNGAPYCKLHA